MQALAWQKLVDETKQQAALRAASQKWLRGFYVGGTMCFEALCLLRQETNLPLHSNLCFEGVAKLPDSSRSVQNTLVDFGEEEFTLGRVHPMIDPSLRHLRILQEANDPEVAVPMPRAVALVALGLQDSLRRLAEMVGAAQHDFEERFGDDLSGARQYLMATPEADHAAAA